MKQTEDFVIEHVKVTEFEFENFSVFFNIEENLWFLETYDDEDEVERVIVENNEGMKYEHNKEFFQKMEFSEEAFETLKNFVRARK